MTRSELMSRIKSKNTGPERRLWRALRKAGLYYRRHARVGVWRTYTCDALARLTKSLDNVVSWPQPRQIAVFVHGCFWHGHAGCYRTPRTNVRFWEDKVRNNTRRDRRAAAAAKNDRHIVVTLWECEDDARWARKIQSAVRKAGA